MNVIHNLLQEHVDINNYQIEVGGAGDEQIHSMLQMD